MMPIVFWPFVKTWKNVLNDIGMCTCSLLVLLGCQEGSPSLDSTIEDSEDYFLFATDSIGIEEGDDEYIFGKIRDVNYLANGTIVVIDQSFQRIRLYSPTGHHLKEVIGNGVGPG